MGEAGCGWGQKVRESGRVWVGTGTGTGARGRQAGTGMERQASGGAWFGEGVILRGDRHEHRGEGRGEQGAGVWLLTSHYCFP